MFEYLDKGLSQTYTVYTLLYKQEQSLVYHIMAGGGDRSLCVRLVEEEAHRSPRAEDEKHQHSALPLRRDALQK